MDDWKEILWWCFDTIIGIIIAALIIFLLGVFPIYDCGYQLPYYHCSIWFG